MTEAPTVPEPLAVLFDATSIAPPLTGIGRYAQELLRALLARPDLVSIEAVRHGRRLDPIALARKLPPPTGGTPRVRRLIRALPLAYEALHRVRAARFAAASVGARASVYHEPNYILKPFAGAAVVTCHDLSHLRYPAFHPRERVRFLERHLAASLARAARVIVPSRFVRGEVMEAFGLAEEKVAVVAEGVGPPFGREPGDDDAVLAGFGLSQGGFVLSVATLEPRKNLETVLAAHEALPAALRARFPLVLAGAAGWKEGPLLARIDRLERGGSVRRLGYVDDAALAAVYRGARAFVFLPHYEGFGLPALEAMASGTPMVAADAASLPEIVGEAGALVAPKDEGAAAEALRRLLEDAAERERLSAFAAARARAFTWDDAASATVAVYRDAVTS